MINERLVHSDGEPSLEHAHPFNRDDCNSYIWIQCIIL